jgi:glyoxylase-like metal-dependent hydrolase (beta-lactamase superfamily II)
MTEEQVQRVANQGWDERIIVCRYGRLVDTFVVVTTRYVVIVDTVINPQTGAQMLEIAREHLADDRQLLVVNTHADYDHCWGNQVFDAPIIGTRLCAERFRQPEAGAYLKEMQEKSPELYADVHYIPPNVLFEERLLIDGGDLSLELFATPGHTIDHASIYIPEINTLLAADAAETPFPFAREVALLPTMRDSLARLAAMNASTALYCHAPATIGPALLRDNIAYFDKLEQTCREALERGVPARPAEDADVAAWVGCTFDDAMPAHLNTPDIHEWYRTQGHAQQLRMMLEWLGTGSQSSELLESSEL